MKSDVIVNSRITRHSLAAAMVCGILGCLCMVLFFLLIWIVGSKAALRTRG